MKKIVFFSIPLFGHVNYGLKIAKTLQSKGHDVVYYSGTAYKSFIENTGVKFHPYSDEIERLFSFKESTYNNEYMQNIRAEELDHIFEWYKFCYHLYSITDIFMKTDIKNMETPDLVIYDSAALWGKRVAEYWGIKSIASCTPYTYPKAYALANPTRFAKMIFQKEMNSKEMLRLIHVLQLKLNNSLSSKDCSIFEPLSPLADYKLIYTAEEFQAGSEFLDKETTFYCGVIQEKPAINIDYSDLLSVKLPNVYIAFGSIYNNPKVFKQIFESCKNLEYNFILNVGSTIDKSIFSKFPNNWKIVERLNQFELLKSVDAFVSHGGVNSIREAMHQGTPVVVIPSEGDTLCTAEDIKAENLGIVVDIHYIDKVNFAVEEIIENKKYKKNCNLLSKTMQQCCGLNGAAEIVEKLF